MPITMRLPIIGPQRPPNFSRAFTMSQDTWVKAKTFVFLPLVFVFTLALVFWIMRRHPVSEAS